MGQSGMGELAGKAVTTSATMVATASFEGGK